MSATKPADLKLALQKVTEVFTAIMDRPTDNDIIDIRQQLLPVLIKTKYDELTLTHNLSGVIPLTGRYEHIYKKGAYLIPPVIALYDDTIDKDDMRTKVHQADGKHEAKRNDRALYAKANTSCKNFIMEVVNETYQPFRRVHGHFSWIHVFPWLGELQFSLRPCQLCHLIMQ